MLGCESNCLQTSSFSDFSFAIFAITFCLFLCPYLLLALRFLHQLYCCSFLVFHEQHWQFRKSKSYDLIFPLLGKKHCPGRTAQKGQLKFSGCLEGKATGRRSLLNTSFFLRSLLQDKSRYTVSASATLFWDEKPCYSWF